MRKVIGIPAYINENRNCFGVGISYLEFASKYGVPRLIMPEEEFVDVDLLLLTGGADMNPDSFGAVPGFRTSHTDVFKQFFYDRRLDSYIDNNIPIIGICLGMQQLAAKFGSRITQDLKYHASYIDSKGLHKMRPVNGTGAIKLFEGKLPEVNSRHHQGVLISDLGDSLVPLFTSDDEYMDNLVEVFRHASKPIYGLQYHPEDILDDISDKIMNQLLSENGSI